MSDNAAPHLQLSRIVELEIIPRLMLLHGRYPPGPAAPSPAPAITAAHVETLCQLALDEDAQRSARYVRELVAAGVGLAQVYLHLLAPAARQMGQFWTEDVYCFSQVTIGLWRLQQILHEHSAQFQATGAAGGGGRILLATPPGATHTFGVAMLAEFFGRAGWWVHHEPQSTWDEISVTLAVNHFDVMGLSIGVDEAVPEVASAIIALRKTSQNRGLYVMVGGPALSRLPDLAERCGADGSATDADDALALANQQLTVFRQAS